MEEQKAFVEGAGDLGGTMRLGPLPGRRSTRGLGRRARPTATTQVEERHRHRYEVNNAYREQLEEAGLVFSGTSPGRQPGRVRRAARATCTPTTSRPRPTPSSGRGPTAAAPAVRGLVGAAIERQRAARLVEVERQAPAETVSAP